MRFSLVRRAALAAVVTGAVVLPGVTPAQAAATGTVSGRLTTSTGVGAADAQVEVLNSDTYATAGWTTTDADGRWSVGGLAGGRYLVGFHPVDLPAQYYRQKAQVWDAEPVTVSSGGTATADDQLRATGVLTGRITTASGAPVSWLSVNATKIDDYEQAYGSTDEDGRYRIAATPGTYTLSFQPIEGSYQTQYAPGKIDEVDAGRYEVTADAETTVDETVLGVGSLSGRFTTTAGQPLANADVSVNTANMYGGADTRTGADGTFTVPALLAGSYKVRFESGDRMQYYRGKLDYEDANLVVVQGGQRTRITDALLGTGSVRIAAVDSVSGAPVADFCVSSDETCSGGTGVVTLTGLPQGRHDFYVYAPDGLHFNRQLSKVKVVAGQTTEVAPKLRPGAVISTTIVDRATGRPVADVCVDAFLPKQAALRDGHGNCSDRAGRIRVGPLAAGTYRLFATPGTAGYGRQWVGAEGGTGDERQAATVAATVGTVTAGPQVRLDPAGRITGTVTDATTGAPAASVDVSVLTGHPGVGVDDATTDAQGRYTLDRLGPYAWPVVFSGNPHAAHWSGDAVSRFTATPVTVTAGGTATHDTAMRPGSTVTGTFTLQGGPPSASGYVIARSADTGDIAGAGWMSDGRFTLRVTGKQRVYFTYDVRSGDRDYSGRYLVTNPDGTRKLALFVVPATGTLTVDLVVPTN
ncbi:carboxypeptidase regulatory-like domain-containing protein [Micromonospora sp. NBS 11-29]|uniref:carboxypeptidase regulatory-like domain-containing protein n=1 Tax=Micromonospora sp. NBS 11-29 TaxID=1960879 RepID=UPI000B774925|nr:carboxypeptidase regulatory-like domain-containing protein [Micromonospora sp. NBS 11-29]